MRNKIKGKIASSSSTGAKWFVIKDNKDGTFKGLILRNSIYQFQVVDRVHIDIDVSFTKAKRYK